MTGTKEVGKGTKGQSPGNQAGKDTARDRAGDMWRRDKEWVGPACGCFLVSNFMTRSLAPMPAGARPGVGTARDASKGVSDTPLACCHP